MAGPMETVDLECPCERKTKQFRRVHKLRYHPNLGVHETPDGYQCVACGEPVAVTVLISQATLKRKQQELDQLKAEVESCL